MENNEYIEHVMFGRTMKAIDDVLKQEEVLSQYKEEKIKEIINDLKQMMELLLEEELSDEQMYCLLQ